MPNNKPNKRPVVESEESFETSSTRDKTDVPDEDKDDTCDGLAWPVPGSGAPMPPARKR
jgi:hypothetical protein